MSYGDKEIRQKQAQLANETILGAMGPKPEVVLAQEIAALRGEIRELRQELAPVPSLIVTGRQALDEFQRLTRKA